MSQQDFLASHHVVVGLYPVADAFAGGVSSDVISMKDYRRCTFFVFTGAVEDANISNIVTVDACSTAAAGATTAIAFKSRVCASSTTVDAWGALTDRASTGHNFATATPAANAVWMVEVDAADMEAAAAGYPFVRLTIAETANKTVTACCIVILSDPRHPVGTPLTAIA